MPSVQIAKSAIKDVHVNLNSITINGQHKFIEKEAYEAVEALVLCGFYNDDQKEIILNVIGVKSEEQINTTINDYLSKYDFPSQHVKDSVFSECKSIADKGSYKDIFYSDYDSMDEVLERYNAKEIEIEKWR